MDWSSVFDDEGEEDGNWVREEISSRARILNLFGKDGYTPLVCYAFTVNYILGVGCLGIPYAFLQSGVVLGSVLIVALSIVSYVTVLWVASATQQEITIAAYHLTKSTNPFIMSPFSSQVRKNHHVRNKPKSKHRPQSLQHPSSRRQLSALQIDTAGETTTPSSAAATGNRLMLSLKSVMSSTTMESLGLLSSATTPIYTTTTVQPGGKISYSSLSPLENGEVEANSGVSPVHHQHSLEEEWHFTSLPSSTRQTNHNHHKAPHKHISSSRATSTDNLNALQQQQSALERMDVQELEVTDLAEEFLGNSGKFVYQTALLALTYVGLLAYTQVFNETFRLQLWPTVPRWLPAFIFAVIVVPLSCCDLQEQIAVQVTMSLLRFVSLGILVIGTLVALYVDYPHAAMAHAALTPTADAVSIPYMQWTGFGVMFTTAIFSQLFQHSVPGLIRPLSKENKKHIPTIFRSALVTTALLYIVTGCVCVLYFGDRLNQSVNLNFVGFTWGLSPSSPMYYFVKALAMVVVLFPALDTLSVFPLIAITLGNNLHAAFPHMEFVTSPSPSPAQQPPQLQHNSHPQHSAQHQQQKRMIWRLIAAIPPILCSLSVRHLVISLQIAGLCGIIVALIFPALLHQHAQVRSEMLPLSWSTLPFQDISLLRWCRQWYNTCCCMCRRSNEVELISNDFPFESKSHNVGEAVNENAQNEWQFLQQYETFISVTSILLIAAVALCISLYQMIL